jgi:predicted Rossmann fold nucleotide-binding protein DprA/Smf involved in DNA uptake
MPARDWRTLRVESAPALMLTESPDLFTTVNGTLVPARYPNHSVAHEAGNLRDRVLQALRQRPSTADELAGVLGETPFSIRPRVTELAKLGKILETDNRRRNASGRLATVWRARLGA